MGAACDHGRGVRESCVIGIDRWERMHAELLLALVTDEGSLRNAAKVLGVPRSTRPAFSAASRRSIASSSADIGDASWRAAIIPRNEVLSYHCCDFPS
jgi:hypothetical protein